MAPKSIQNEANLAQGFGKGYPKINRNMKKKKKNKRKRKHNNDKQTPFLLCAAISSKNVGLNGWAFTEVLWNKKKEEEERR